MLRTLNILDLLKSKLTDLGLLTKFRLSSMVVFSAVVGYIVSIKGQILFDQIIILSLGGFLVTGAANALNEVFEKEYDGMMNRTKNRPLAAGRMSNSEAVLWAGVFCLSGTFLLLTFNIFAGLLGMLSLVLYAFIYTPLKRFTPISVWVGALPGALPILIGGVAANGYFTTLVVCLFMLQVLWQFPHFWAIAWVADEDYKNAGFRLLPTKDGEKNSAVGFQSFFYAILLVACGTVPYFLGLMSPISALIIFLVSIYFAHKAWILFIKSDYQSARSLMFASFIYLPVVLIVFLIDKLIIT